MNVSRRNFLKLTAAGLATATGYSENALKSGRREMICGWTTCLTYQAGERKLGLAYYSRLLDEMKAHGMNRLIVMMASHGYFSPGNHGLAWPVRNPKLAPQIDNNALNAREETEFFLRVIRKAHRLGIEVFIEIKYLGMIGVREGYPGVEFLTRRDGTDCHRIPDGAGEYERRAIQSLHLCCDSDPAHRYIRDKLRDVLERYRELDGVVLEHPSYFGDSCFCSGSREKFIQATGKSLDTAEAAEVLDWKNTRIRDTLTDLKRLVKSIKPDFQFGFYSGVSPNDGNVAAYQRRRGHQIETLKQVGMDFVMPYCEGKHREREGREIEKVVDYLAPLNVYVHVTIRKDMPRNYTLPPKGPKYVKQMVNWGKQTFEENDRFLGMTFFNEVKIPPENRQAVYESI
jgi:hypothetical protein